MATRRVSIITGCEWRLGSGMVVAGAMMAIAACTPASDHEEVATGSSALLGDALPGLGGAQFDQNADTFAEVETVEDGVGPVFNERACGNCHSVGALGGS